MLGFLRTLCYTVFKAEEIVTVNISGGEKMNMQENARLILGLRAKGWTDTEIADFLLYIESGDEQYKPKPSEE